MVKINGRPFLHYLLDQLSDQGIKQFLLLTGYLGEKIIDYFGDGSSYGWLIEYSKGEIEWDTGKRLYKAQCQIKDEFLLLYSDNFIQFNLAKLVKKYQENKSLITLHLSYKNNGNIKVDLNSRILAYDNLRKKEFNFVEVGYMLVQKKPVFKLFRNLKNFPNFSFSEVLKYLSSKNQVSGLIIKDKYHSISDPKRYKFMQEYLSPKKILILDRDGTINKKAKEGYYISNWKEFEWIKKL